MEWSQSLSFRKCINVYNLHSGIQKSLNKDANKKGAARPGRVAWLVKALSWHTKVVDLILRQGAYKNQPMNA